MGDWDMSSMWDSGSGGDTSGWNMSDSWLSGGDTDVSDTSGWDMSEAWGNGSGNTDTADWASGLGSGVDNDYDWNSDSSGDSGGGDSGGGAMSSMASGAAAGSAFGPWGAVIGAGLGLVSSYFGGKADEKAQKEKLKQSKELIAFQHEQDELYYQKHGKQLQDAIGGYKKYYQAPGLAAPTSMFGEQAGQGGGNGYFR